MKSQSDDGYDVNIYDVPKFIMSETEVGGIIILVLRVKRGLIQGKFLYISPRNMHDALLRGRVGVECGEGCLELRRVETGMWGGLEILGLYIRRGGR